MPIVSFISIKAHVFECWHVDICPRSSFSEQMVSILLFRLDAPTMTFHLSWSLGFEMSDAFPMHSWHWKALDIPIKRSKDVFSNIWIILMMYQVLIKIKQNKSFEIIYRCNLQCIWTKWGRVNFHVFLTIYIWGRKITSD